MESLIEIFENKPSQNVSTFNSIFKKTPILGYPAGTEVEIFELYPEDKRRIVVGDDILYLKIAQPKKKPKKPKQEYMHILPKTEISETKLPEIYKLLNPSQFMIYMAIQTLGEAGGIEDLSRQLSINRRTVYNNLKELVKLKLVRTEMVSIKGKSVLKISIDLS